MKKIVMVDDEVDFCELIADSLKNAGLGQIITCSDSTKALGLIMDTKPDLVLLDIRMPVISGDQIASELRANDEFKKIPIIFLTALVDNRETQGKENFIGNNIFLAKPVKIKELINTVRNVLDNTIAP